MIIKSILIFVFVSVFTICVAQPHSIAIIIKNQPDNIVVLGAIKGDDFIIIDSAFAEKELIRFNLHKDAESGMYRIIMGQTPYAKIMNEAPQQLDFIFNKESIVLETDFKSPETKTKVIESVENEIWFDFIQKEQFINHDLREREKEVNYYWAKDKTDEAIKVATEYNQLQVEYNLFITETAKKNNGTFAAKVISTYTEPLLDGYLTEIQRKELFQKEYFKALDFTDESLMNSQGYTNNIFKYLISYNKKGLTQEQREKEYIKAADIILTNTNKNEKIYEFILKYIIHGFEVLQFENVITYIAINYSGTTCQTDEYTTLERKLEEQKMISGTSVADFTINNINSNPITFSNTLKEKNIVLFWASWCPHCTDFIKQLESWQKQAKNSNIEIFAISLDTDKEVWKNKVLELRIESWYNLSDFKEWESKIAIDYNVFATPTIFVVDKNLKIIGKAESFYELTNLEIFR
ncbi:MAG: TlpA family protein disulfide reductase [Draconibacterium sp.]|nr:TlpA family protein disulfide reductase [Draconibacterium sp.]